MSTPQTQATGGANPAKSLAALLALPVQVEVGGQAILLQPMGWQRAAEAFNLLASVDLPSLPEDAGQITGDTLGEWLHVLDINGAAVNEFLHLATGFELAELAELPPLTMAELLFRVVEVNADFFVRSLPGLIQRVGREGAALKAKLAQATQVMQTTPAGLPTTSSS